MVTEPSLPTVNESSMDTESLIGRPPANKKNHGKVPKKIHKAEREKLKRDHLNELFLALGHALEPSRQNNGKASILGDAARLLRDLLAQVECLRKENVALLSESHYVTLEKNEVKDENNVLGAEIEKLKNELKERMQSDPGWSNGARLLHSRDGNLATSLPGEQLSVPVPETALQPLPVVGPVFVIPLQPEIRSYQEDKAVEASSEPPSQVMRPQARYPTPSDSWPSQILAPRTTLEAQPNSSTSTTTTSNSELGSGIVLS